MTPECWLCIGTHCKDRHEDDGFGTDGSIAVVDTQSDEELIFEHDWQVEECEGIKLWGELGDKVELKAIPPPVVEKPLEKGYKEVEQGDLLNGFLKRSRSRKVSNLVSQT